MATKEISVKKYVVRLSGEERERLETLIRKGKSPARRVLKARILLKADVSEAGKGWSDNRIIEALETSPSMVGAQMLFGIVARVHYDRQIDTTSSWTNCASLSSPPIARLLRALSCRSSAAPESLRGP
jgi:hypothetical protein